MFSHPGTWTAEFLVTYDVNGAVTTMQAIGKPTWLHMRVRRSHARKPSLRALSVGPGQPSILGQRCGGTSEISENEAPR